MQFHSSPKVCRVQVKAGELATAEGLSYLEAKHLLLLSYCTHIVFYVLLKAEGAPVRDHPVIGRLLQLRTYLVRRLFSVGRCNPTPCTTLPVTSTHCSLSRQCRLCSATGKPLRCSAFEHFMVPCPQEKLRPIDRKLAYQVEKMLAAGQQAPADGADAAAADPLSFGPRPEALVPRAAAGNAADPADAGAPSTRACKRCTLGAAAICAARLQVDSVVHGSFLTAVETRRLLFDVCTGQRRVSQQFLLSHPGVYRPPRLAMAAMEDDPDRRQSAKERRREREASRRGGRSALVHGPAAPGTPNMNCLLLAALGIRSQAAAMQFCIGTQIMDCRGIL